MTDWHHKLSTTIAAQGPGSYIVDFPAYRPDLVEALAAMTGCAYLDFRARAMAPLGFAAHTLSLDTLEEIIERVSGSMGVVLQNGEALLATRPAEQRLGWLTEFLARKRARLAILPLALFGREVAAHPRVVRLLPHEVPAEGFITQLASTRLAP